MYSAMSCNSNSEHLHQLYASLDDCGACTTVAYNFRHVPGGGCADRAEWMLVLINPTPRNPTAHADWEVPRFPMAAKGRFWRLLAEAGLVSPDLPQRLELLGPTPQMVEQLVTETQHHGLYLTNAVKCVDGGSNVPRAARLERGWRILQAEIAAVRPQRIVAFGLLPFGMLTGHTIRLTDELWKARNGYYTPYNSHVIAGASYPVYPCYFPTGRGNPAGAREMLTLLQRQTQIAVSDSQ